MRFGLFATGLAVFALGGIGSGLVLAHSGATGVTKDRMDRMGDIAAQMKILTAFAKGSSAFVADRIPDIADRLKVHGVALGSLFPEGSNAHPSEASDLIWEDSAGFEAELQRFREITSQFAERANGLTAAADLNPILGQLATSCKTCHKAYRLKK